MFRSLTTRPGRGYEKLSDPDSSATATASASAKEQQQQHHPFATKLDRARSLPAKFFGSRSRRLSNPDREEKKLEKADSKELKKASKIHPVFNFVDGKLRKKATANPQVSRYLQYLKDGGGKLYTISETSSGTIIS